MPEHHLILRADDSRLGDLEADGWTVAARSWAAQLSATEANRDRLRSLVDRVAELGEPRALREDDVDAVLELDAATISDYPGSIATRHVPLTRERAQLSLSRRAFGVFTPVGRALAVTYVDIDADHAETDFTVVDRVNRGQGLGSAVKAASVLALLDDGVQVFRTGGSADNAASLAANQAVGYSVDEHWITLTCQD